MFLNPKQFQFSSIKHPQISYNSEYVYFFHKISRGRVVGGPNFVAPINVIFFVWLSFWIECVITLLRYFKRLILPISWWCNFICYLFKLKGNKDGWLSVCSLMLAQQVATWLILEGQPIIPNQPNWLWHHNKLTYSKLKK